MKIPEKEFKGGTKAMADFRRGRKNFDSVSSGWYVQRNGDVIKIDVKPNIKQVGCPLMAQDDRDGEWWSDGQFWPYTDSPEDLIFKVNLVLLPTV